MLYSPLLPGLFEARWNSSTRQPPTTNSLLHSQLGSCQWPYRCRSREGWVYGWTNEFCPSNLFLKTSLSVLSEIIGRGTRTLGTVPSPSRTDQESRSWITVSISAVSGNSANQGDLPPSYQSQGPMGVEPISSAPSNPSPTITGHQRSDTSQQSPFGPPPSYEEVFLKEVSTRAFRETNNLH